MNNKLKIGILIGILLFTAFLAVFNYSLDKHTNSNDINIAFCIDNKYKKILPIVIYSIHRNNTSKSKYHFYIFTNTLNFKERLLLSLFIKRIGYEATIKKIDTTPIDKGENLYKKNSIYNKHITRIGSARLLMPEFLPKHLSKILYLDADIIATKDILEIYNTDISNYTVAMARDFGLDEDYYNDGVLLINLTKWKKDNVKEKIMAENYNQFVILDQDLLNKIFKNKIKLLPYKYDYMYIGYGGIKMPESEIYIRHYTTDNKPQWNDAYNLDSIYFKYKALFYKKLKSDKIINMIYRQL